MTADAFHKSPSSNQIFLVAFLFSILLHLLFFSSFPVGGMAISGIDKMNKQNIMRVQRIKQDQGQLVDLMDQKHVTNDPVESDYLSDKNRKVEKQTRSLQVQRQQVQTSAATPNKNVAEKKSKYSLDITDKALQNLAENGKPVLNQTISSNYLPEISIGDETLLNTKEFAFHTFYLRMKREIEGFWHPDRVIIQNQFLHGTYITTMNVVLNEDGYILQVSLLKTSGVPALDAEAKTAIEQASPFPNPPKELLGEDQKIRVNWNFIFDRSMRM